MVDAAVPLADALRDLSRIYNYAEALIWPAMGVVLLAAATRRRGADRRDFALAGVVLFAFGVSDYFEAETGNRWWEPWWLFLWKAACVAALLTVLIVAWRREQQRKRAKRESAKRESKVENAPFAEPPTPSS